MADIIFRDFGDKVKRGVRSAIDIGMDAMAQQAEGNAIRETNILIYETPPSPTYVRTGDLRKSIAHEYVKEEKAAYVGSTIYYAPYVEYGTVHMKERPFLKNAVLNYKDEYAEILQQALANID